MAARFMADISDGVIALHFYGVVHADLKPANILLFPDAQTQWVAKVADFGARGVAVQLQNPGSGTHRWRAPELAAPGTSASTSNSFNLRDIYAYGLLVGYNALDGVFPLPDEGPFAQEKSVAVDTIKSSDQVLHQVKKMVEGYLGTGAFLGTVISILQAPLRAHPEDRIKDLSDLRMWLDPFT